MVVASGTPQSNLPYTLFFVVSFFPFNLFPTRICPWSSSYQLHTRVGIPFAIYSVLFWTALLLYQYISVYLGHSLMVMCLLTWNLSYKNLVFWTDMYEWCSCLLTQLEIAVLKRTMREYPPSGKVLEGCDQWYIVTKDEHTGMCMLVVMHSDQSQDWHELEIGTENSALNNASNQGEKRQVMPPRLGSWAWSVVTWGNFPWLMVYF